MSADSQRDYRASQIAAEAERRLRDMGRSGFHEGGGTCENVAREWEKTSFAHACTSFCCSECGAHYVDAECYYAGLADKDEEQIRTNFCPNCGAPKRGAVCEYCGTHFGRYQGQATVEVEPDITTIYSWDGSSVYQIVNGCNVNVKVVDEC